MLNYQIFAIGLPLGNIINIYVELHELGRDKLMSIFWSVLRSEEIKAETPPATQHSESSRLRMDRCTSPIELSELGMGGPVRRGTF